MAEIASVRVHIEGRVQGVWFRGWAVQQARLRQLAGWVRNLPDGSVEALFSGPADDVNEMVRLCRRGPPAAHVTAAKAESADPPIDRGFYSVSTR
jgi:acylphosphatase